MEMTRKWMLNIIHNSKIDFKMQSITKNEERH